VQPTYTLTVNVSVSGELTDAAGSTLTVFAGPDVVISSTVAGDGTFMSDLPAGDYTLSLTRDGYDITVTAGGSVSLTGDATVDLQATSGLAVQPRIVVDASSPGHVVSRHIFGDQIEWVDDAEGTWDPATQQLRASLTVPFAASGTTLLRYPAGTLADFFHWDESVGDVATRLPQVNPFLSDGTTQVTEVPLFGPDEAADLATWMGADVMYTLNVGTGSVQEAADWVQHTIDQNIDVAYWEVGNEVYLAGDEWAAATQRKTPSEYATIYDAYASAIRAKDPLAQVGLIGIHDSWIHSLAHDPTWNQVVLSNITEPADFMAIHNFYAPITVIYDADDELVNSCMLAAPEFVKQNLASLKQDIVDYAGSANQDLPFAVTEHASFFVPGDADLSLKIKQLERNRSLAAALFSALEFNIMISEPRIIAANHLHLSSPYWQAQLTTATDGHSQPVRSAYGLMFTLYRVAAEGTYRPASVTNAPTFDTVDYGYIPGQQNVPVLDAVAVTAPTADTLWVFVVNRSLDTDLSTHLRLSVPGTPSAVTADTLTADSYTAFNEPGLTPAVAVTSTTLSTQVDFVHSFPKHSLTRIELTY
jgi:alpha-N-arabinofuranosidase